MSDNGGMLGKMTESLFAETLKRIAEDVWKQKFVELVGSVRGSYSREETIKKLMLDVMIECLKQDEELRQHFVDTWKEALHNYLNETLLAEKSRRQS